MYVARTKGKVVKTLDHQRDMALQDKHGVISDSINNMVTEKFVNGLVGKLISNITIK